MKWYKYLYVDEKIASNKKKVIWKIRHNAGQMDVYVISLAMGSGKLLEIIVAAELLQRGYPKKDLFIVGIAKGYASAVDLACSIIMEIYKKTGGFQVKEYLLKKQEAEVN